MSDVIDDACALILFKTSAPYKSFTYLLTYLWTVCRRSHYPASWWRKYLVKTSTLDQLWPSSRDVASSTSQSRSLCRYHGNCRRRRPSTASAACVCSVASPVITLLLWWWWWWRWWCCRLCWIISMLIAEGPVLGRGTPLPPCPFTSSFFPLFTFPFLSLALPIFFFCPSLPFLPE